jgi:type IV pilus assembly protein PilY1
VLILLDNTANWNRSVAGQAININERAAMAEILKNLPVNTDGSAKFRVGLMLFTETGSPNNNTDGGYMRAAIRDMNATTKPLYEELLLSLDSLADMSNGGKAGKTMSETYQYFSGRDPFSGNGKVKTDYRGNTYGTIASRAIYALPENAIQDSPSGDYKNGYPYNSPVDPDGCAGNYIIYISNGAVQDNTADTREATQRLAAAAQAERIPNATTAIPISPSGSQDNVADEWARFMRRSHLNAVTYTVDVDKVTSGQGPGWSKLLESMATVSDGKYFSVTSGSGGKEIADALGRIFSEIQAVNSVFASVSLPVSVNTEGTYLNQVYIGMFRPDQDAFPRWSGNLKQYKLGVVSDMLRTLDADANPAINPLTGFITECARSFWTPTVIDNYWGFHPQGGCLAIPGADNSNYPDGNVVEKGAQGYTLRGRSSRTLRTCRQGSTYESCSALIAFNGTNVTETMLGVPTAERDPLISWEVGYDIDDENLNSNKTEMRPSIHGDVVHSRPAAINFGTEANPKVVVFYGANDGVLRAVNGSRSDTIAGVPAGGEMWAFVPPEFYRHMERLRKNLVQISFFGTPTIVPPPEPKPYGVDGPISVFQDASNTWVFAGMRRGGRSVYAFDVSGMAKDSPDTVAPSLKWRKGCDDVPDLLNPTNPAVVRCASGFEEIGQTWSTAKVFKTNGHTGPMLIMGGGYDPCEDQDVPSGSPCAATRGNRIYVMDAGTGQLLKTFDTDRAVVADVFLIPDGTTGLSKLAYAADMGGNIYRISGVNENQPFSDTDPTDWVITKIASLGCDTATTCTPNRKFMFSPDIVEKNGTYYLLVGSGDREKPVRGFVNAYGVENYFFMVQDNPSDDQWLADGAITLSDLYPIANDGTSPEPTVLADYKGWALAMKPHEQVVTSAITIFGVTTFSSHEPTVPVEGACTSNLGTARVYNIKFSNAAIANGTNNRDQPVSGGGLPPSPVAGRVTLDNGVTVPFLIGGSPESPLESRLPTGTVAGSQPKSVTYWYIEK